MVIILMGVSGCGKTTVGQQLAARLSCAFEDADDYHPLANKDKMRSGIALTDADRIPWLDTLAKMIRQRNDEGRLTVLACSALTRFSRNRLGCNAEDVLLVHLVGSKELIKSRMQSREHEYMPDSLLDSQFETLELPTEVVGVVSVDIAENVESIVDRIIGEYENRSGRI